MIFKRKIFTICFFVIGAVVIISYFFSFILNFTAFEQYRTRSRLLSKTNYKHLLKACRELSIPIHNPDNPEIFETRINYSAKDFSQNPSLGMSNISIKVIKYLNPQMISIYDTGLVIFSMGNTFWSFGISAYPEDYKGKIPEWFLGDRELLPGLWYFDEKYKTNQNYNKEIDALIKKNKGN